MLLTKSQDEPVILFPFEGMGVGDSFFVPTLKPSNMLYIIDNRAKAAGVRTKAFVIMHDGCLGVRVWRTA
jgi:hypothetical protein